VNLVERQSHQLRQLALPQGGHDHLGRARPGDAQQVPGMPGVQFGAVARRRPGQVVVPGDQPGEAGRAVETSQRLGQGQVLVERADVVGDQHVEPGQRLRQLGRQARAQRLEAGRHAADVQLRFDVHDHRMP
jgi:hypothetical protein